MVGERVARVEGEKVARVEGERVARVEGEGAGSWGVWSRELVLVTIILRERRGADALEGEKVEPETHLGRGGGGGVG